MIGIYLDVVRQREKLAVNADVQLGGILARSTREIGSTDRANEQRVACKNEPRIQAPSEIGHDQTDTVMRVAGSVQHFHTSVAELNLLSVSQRFERKGYISGLVQVVGGASASSEIPPARPVIRVDVGVDRVGDAQARRRSEIEVGLIMRIDDGRGCRSRTGPPRSQSRTDSKV